MDKKEIRVRFAPSPTGPLHMGGVRTALFNWLFARQNDGKFILRIEDTDKERSDKKWEKEILDGLLWLGLNWDEEYRQSERTEIYKKYLEKLIAEGKAYYCYCSREDLEAERQVMLAQGLAPKYSGHCRNLTEPPKNKQAQVIRFKTPESIVEFKDMIRGTLKFDASLFGDLVIAKDLNTPLYNFAAVVDDEEMKMTHIIRGEDHISNTPKQILLQKALGFRELEYAHIPLILAPDRSKLSKRHLETSFIDYKEKGYLPGAIINFLALLGWHPKDDREVFTKDELIKEFNLKRVQKAGAVFNLEKLDWLQKEYSKLLTDDEMIKLLVPVLKKEEVSINDQLLKKIMKVERGRITNLTDFLKVTKFFFELPDYDARLLVWQKGTVQKTLSVLENIFQSIKNLKSPELDAAEVAKLLEPMIAEEGRGAVLWPLRVALSGLAASPDPMEIISVLERAEVEKRLKLAIEKIKGLVV